MNRNCPILALVIAGWLLIAWYAHRHFLPYDVNNTDIGTYLYQAQTFADGHLYRPTPEPRAFFQQWQAIVRDRSYAYYPPGHALLLALPLRWQLDPWIIPWLLSGLTLFLVYRWSVRLFDSTVALFAVGTLSLSPFFAANGASLLSHSSTLCATAAFLCFATHWQQKGTVASACASGLLLGWIFATRSPNAAALGLTWIPWILWSRRITFRHEWRQMLACGAGGLAVLLPLLIYYHALSGRWATDLFTDYWPRNRFGFGTDLGRGEPGHFFQTHANHDWHGMLTNWVYFAKSLAIWWSGNPWLSLAGIALAVILYFIRSPRHSTLPLILVAWPLTHIALYSLYYTPSTPFSGPRYIAELMPALAVATGWILSRMVQWRQGRWIAGLSFTLFAIVASHHRMQFYQENEKGTVARRQVEDCVHQNAVQPAIVFIRSFWLGHPFPIFLNRSSLNDPILFACDRGEEDNALVEKYPERNAYVLVVDPKAGDSKVAQLVPIYQAATRTWLKQPGDIVAPFFVGGQFTPPLALQGENARVLFHPRAEEIPKQ